MNYFQKIKSILKKKKEKVLVDLCLKDYEGTNFYFAIVLNQKIEKYRVLFVPIDAIDDGDSIEDYFCYQFIFFDTVDYLIHILLDNKSLFENQNIIHHNSSITSYYIESNISLDHKDYCFTFTQVIDKRYPFFFDIVSIIFEHSPNIVSELCHKLLANFYQDKNTIPIQKSMSFDVLENLIPKKHKSKKEIDYLEKIGNKYFGIISGKLTIIEMIEEKRLLNIYSKEKDYLDDAYYLLKDIILNKDKKFIQIQMNDEKGDTYTYYTFGIQDDHFLILNEDGYEEIPVYHFIQPNIQILYSNEEFRIKLRKVLEEKYIDEKVEEILKTILVLE